MGYPIGSFYGGYSYWLTDGYTHRLGESYIFGLASIRDDRPIRTFLGEDNPDDELSPVYLRRWAGVNESYSGLDDDLREIALAAIERVSQMIGTSATTAERTDVFARWDSVLVLTERALTPPTIAYTDAEGGGQLLEPSLWTVDETVSPTRLVFSETPTLALSTHLDGPITVTYEVGARHGERGWVVKEAVRQAYQLMVEGSPRGSDISWESVRRLLQPRMPSKSRMRVL